MKQIRNLKGKRVLVRVDFNVPLKKGKVLDDFRLRATLPTLTYLQEKQANIIIMTHVGRPKGSVIPSLRTAPIAKALSQLLNKNITNLKQSTGHSVKKAIDSMNEGDILFLENIQFDKREIENDPEFAKELASYCDYFVLDCFGQSHREYASIVGIEKYVKSYVGVLMQKEITTLTKLITKSKHPLVTVLGGAKLETKIPVMKSFAKMADTVLLGGALVNTYFKAAGYRVGDSLVNKELQKEALTYGKKRNVVLPVDLVVGTLDGTSYRLVDIKKTPHQICKKGEAILDIGPKTIQLFATHIKSAQTLIWNGAMGYFEQKPYHIGTFAIARLIASRSKGHAFGVIGGGETLQAMDAVDGMDDIDFVSTGGGAMLHFLAGKKLPGIEALS